MDNLEPITRNEMFLNGDDLEPITREEMILAGADLEPLTRHEWFLKKYRGGGDVTIERLNVTQNGTYSESGKAYSPVVVNVPAPPIPENAYLLNDLSDLPADIASFTDGTDLPMASLKVAVTPYQDLSHGDPSPENICPIIGWDEAVVSVSGVNIWDEEWELGQYDASGNPYPNNDCIRTKNFISVKPNTTYYQTTSSGTMQVLYYDINKGFINSAWMGSNTFTTPSNCYYVHFRLGSTYGTTYNHDISINYPSTDTTYHAYNGATYTIDLNGTRYGSELDVLNGVDIDTLGNVDLGTLNWSYNSIQNFFFADLNDIKLTTKNLICDRYIYVEKSWAAMQNGEFGKVANSTQIRFHNDNYNTGADFKTAMSGVQFVYELATPITVQLSPTQVKSLVGTNNIFADCGQITEVKYFKKA